MQIEFCLLVISLHMSENWGLDIAYKNCSNFGDFFSHDTFLVNIELNKIDKNCSILGDPLFYIKQKWLTLQIRGSEMYNITGPYFLYQLLIFCLNLLISNVRVSGNPSRERGLPFLHKLMCIVLHWQISPTRIACIRLNQVMNTFKSNPFCRQFRDFHVNDSQSNGSD